MESAQPSSQEQENLAGQVMDSLGEPESAAEEVSQDDQGSEQAVSPKDELPTAFKERLGRQEKRHKKELRAMQEQMMQMQQRMGSPDQMSSDPMSAPAMPGISPGSAEDQIHKAVSYALNHRDMMDRKAKEAEQVAHVQKQYQRLQDNLDKGSDKYEDFDDVVRAQDAPFTPAMRDAALLVENPADVLYKLGKNPDELKRIATLHPLDQAREVNKLSFALMGGENKASSANSKPISPIKTNPVVTRAVNEKTSIGDLRQRMRSRDWK
jgi:hypothetical protein